MKLILALVAAVALGAVPLTAEAAQCDAWLYEANCSAVTGDLTLDAYRVDHLEYRIRAEACLADPGEMVVAWWVALTDDHPGSVVVSSTPTGDPGCPHHAVAQPLARFGTFDPPVSCGQIAAATLASAGSKLVCQHD